MVTGPAGANPVVPNAGVAVTAAGGGAGAGGVLVAAGLPAPSTGPDVLDRFGSACWPVPVTAAVEVDDDGLSPQPAITASTTSATPRAGARRRTRRSQLLTVIPSRSGFGRSLRLP